MKYEKPEMTELGSAIETVQFLVKKGIHSDCADQPSASPCESNE